MCDTSKSTKKTKKCTNGEKEMLTEERLREIFNEMFSKHEENVKIILASNAKIVNDRLDILTKNISDLQDSIEFVDQDLNEKIKSVEKKISKTSEECQNNISPSEVKEIKNKLIELEDRSRRNNIRIDGIPESEKESWQDCENKILDIFEHNLSLTNIQIERAHRVKRKDTNENGNRPRTIVAKLLDFRDKERIIKSAKNLKGTGIYVNEDYCSETTKLRKSLWEQVKILRDQGKFAYIEYNKIVSRNFRN